MSLYDPPPDEPRREKELRREEVPEGQLVPWFGALLQATFNNIFSVAIALLVVGLLVLMWWLQRGPDLSQDNFDRIVWGMPEAQVRAILGKGPNAPTPTVLPEISFPPGSPPPQWQAWEGREVQVLICFLGGKVHYKQRTSLASGGR